MPYFTTVRARLRDADPTAAREHHNRIVAKLTPGTKANGGIGHSAFGNPQDPRAFLALDHWDSLEGLQRFMSDPAVQQEIGSLFDGPPEVTVWSARDGWTTF